MHVYHPLENVDHFPILIQTSIDSLQIPFYSIEMCISCDLKELNPMPNAAFANQFLWHRLQESFLFFFWSKIHSFIIIICYWILLDFGNPFKTHDSVSVQSQNAQWFSESWKLYFAPLFRFEHNWLVKMIGRYRRLTILKIIYWHWRDACRTTWRDRRRKKK